MGADTKVMFQSLTHKIQLQLAFDILNKQNVMNDVRLLHVSAKRAVCKNVFF